MNTRFQVPTIDIRDRISAEVIDQVAQQIIERFKPLKIILFGSYADGTCKAESDIDLLVVMDTSIREIRQAQQIRQYLNPLFGIDLVVRTPANLARRLELGDLFLQEVISKGEVLYESTHA
ncbi:MAG: nucleotidyltransferase domain-containing protein [Anaerolineaceae bacterium]|nr:nucleotidyltransferase domain-containing protein [Anaerolineaceae bacterium]